MESKVKFIIVGLLGFLFISIFVGLQVYSQKEKVARELEQIKADNASLQDAVAQKQRENKDLAASLDSLKKQIVKVADDRDNLVEKLELVSRAKETLEKQLKNLESETDSLQKRQYVQVQESPEAAPQFTDAYWAGILKAKTDLEFRLDKIEDELRAAQISNEGLLREKARLQLDINDVERQKQDLQRQLEYSQKQTEYIQRLTDNISLKLVNETNDKHAVEDTIKTIKSENELLKRQLRGLDTRKIELEEKVAQLQSKKDDLEKKISDADILLKDKTIALNNIASGVSSAAAPVKPASTQALQDQGVVELPPIIVKPQQSPVEPVAAAASQAGARSGKVLTINKENNFVIIDMGQDKGISAGDMFEVVRADAVIGAIEVIQVRKAISACDIKKEVSAIRIGDTVK